MFKDIVTVNVQDQSPNKGRLVKNVREMMLMKNMLRLQRPWSVTPRGTVHIVGRERAKHDSDDAAHENTGQMRIR